MRINLKIIKGHLIYIFREGRKIIGFLGIFQKGRKITAQELLESLK